MNEHFDGGTNQNQVDGYKLFFVLTFISGHGSDGDGGSSSSITMEVPKNQHVTPKCNKNNIIM